MASYNGNAAYDLSLFEPQERIGTAGKTPVGQRETDFKIRKFETAAERAAGQKNAEKKAPKKISSYKTAGLSFGVIFASAAVLTCLSLLIWKGVTLYELDKDINEIKLEYEAEQSEKTRLNTELKSRISTEKVEYYAENILGMVKLESYNVNYIDFTGENKIVPLETKPSDSESKGFVSRLMALIPNYSK